MTISQPRVSVCVLTCNQRNYIQQCIESVLAQAPDTSLEILVGDDRSDDGTSEIVAALASRYPQLPLRQILQALTNDTHETIGELCPDASLDLGGN